MKSFFVQMRAGPAERRAMVRLLACDVHQGEADMAYYDTRDRLLFNGPLELGLKKDRILQLFDGIGLWPREQRFGGGESQVVERLAGWHGRSVSLPTTCHDSSRVFLATTGGRHVPRSNGCPTSCQLPVGPPTIRPLPRVSCDAH